ncbi:MAG: transporter [Acidobacteria bacterium]|nr:transporter [Acidobacteriota bacterium]
MRRDKDNETASATSLSQTDETRDLGFGSVVASESRQRLLNRDGSFNVQRTGLNFWSSFSLYHSLLALSWWQFLSALTGFFVLVNVVFAFAYVLCGPGALVNTVSQSPPGGELLQAFFFSVQTFSTIGYGNISPVGIAANVVVTAESLVGLLSVALATGLIFARFSRPTAKILFSRNAVVAPYRDIEALMFRVTNARRNQLIELEATVLLAVFKEVGGKKLRRFYPLALERPKVVFFPLSWTIVHPIDEDSPLHGVTHDELLAADAEVLVLFTGIDETFSQTVHTRSSYKAGEIVWGAKFSDIYKRSADSQLLTVDVRRLHHIEPVPPRAEALDEASRR